jgi:glycosyltransferase involved in cell wall biosynthesis
VVSLHHPESLDHLPWKNRAVISAALHLAHEVVVTTPYVQEVLTALPGRLHEVVIPLGIPAPSTAVPGPDLRATLGVPDDAFVIGYLGRLVEYKGLPLLVDAVAAMGGRPMLLVAGDGPEGATIKAEAEQLLGDRVHFLGAVPDRDAFYQALNVFAMPSSLEGFGLAYVEAALHGIPSVASPAGGVPYVVLDKKTGLVVEQTASAVAGALERLHSDPGYARALGERARQHALEQFTDTVMANHYALLFRS